MECIVLKGNQNGLSIVVKNNDDFIHIKTELAKKLEAGKHFFGKNKLNLSFEGLPLIESEQHELVDLFKIHSDLEIISIIDPEEERVKLREMNLALLQKVQQLEERLEVQSEASVQSQVETVPSMLGEINAVAKTFNQVEFYYSTLRSGQQILTDKHVLLIGDVNNGSRIEAGGNVIILGKLKGVVHAGLKTNKASYVIAMDMKPIQIRIKEAYGRASDEATHDSSSTEPQVAYVEDGRIVIEKLNQKVFKDHRFNE